MMLFAKTFEEFYELLKAHEIESTNKYVQLLSERAFSVEKADRFCNFTVHWENGTPYVRIGKRIYVCQHGRDNNLYQKKKYANERDSKAHEDHAFTRRYNKAQLTKKLDCPAKIIVTRVIQFQECKVSETAKRFEKKRMSAKIREKIPHGFGEEGYMFEFPTSDEHQFHLMGASAAVNEPIDARVREHIVQLVRKGERNTIVVSKLLTEFVEKELHENDRLRRRFYPDKKSIRRIISSEKIKMRSSQIDQEETEIVIKNLDTSENHVFFRPSTEASDAFEDEDSKDLLFVYQSKEMKELYRKYGENTIMLDATYKTCKYAIPLYFVVVETNVNFQIVAVFITQFESANSIAEALSVVKNWNPEVTPCYAMVDYAHEEISALQSVFPDIQVYICTFHREQAWGRWLSKSENSAIPRKEALGYFRKIANATTIQSMEEALKALQAWEVYGTTPLKFYFESTWLKEIKRWALAFKPDDMYCNTNNGVERMNKELKYSYLVGFKSCSLSELITVVVRDFLPERYRQYVKENLSMSSKSKKYDQAIPAYLHGRPKWFIDHVVTKLDLASQCLSETSVISEREFKVYSSSNKDDFYDVTLDEISKTSSCNCASFKKERLVCKHILLICLKYPDFKLEKVQSWLFSSQLFRIDEELIPHEHSADSQFLNSNSASRNSEYVMGHLNDDCVMPPIFSELTLTGSQRRQLMNKLNSSFRTLQSLLWHTDKEAILSTNKQIEELIKETKKKVTVDAINKLPIESQEKKTPIRLKRGKYKRISLLKKRGQMGRVGVNADIMKESSKISVNGETQPKNRKRKLSVINDSRLEASKTSKLSSMSMNEAY